MWHTGHVASLARKMNGTQGSAMLKTVRTGTEIGNSGKVCVIIIAIMLTVEITGTSNSKVLSAVKIASHG